MSEVANFATDPLVRPTITFLSSKVSKFSTFTVTRVLRQILVNEVNYQIFVDTKYSPTVTVRQVIHVTESANGNYEIKKSEIVDLAPFDAKRLRKVTSTSEIPYYK